MHSQSGYRPASVRLGVVAAYMAVAAGTCLGAEKTAITIGPGPKSISGEERALAPDPARGSQHGIILVDETIQDEHQGTETNRTHHLRAKIFSNEARSLGDVEIPFDHDRGLLKRWWGYVLLPDGNVLEVKESDLKEQVLAQARSNRYAILKASLPGIVPGCVIDYGYMVLDRGYYSGIRVDIQQVSPVMAFRYRWVPYAGKPASFNLAHAEGLAVNVSRDQRSILIGAQNLPAVLEEPSMPPEAESHASAMLYYRSSSDSPKEFWELEAKRVTRIANAFAKEKSISNAIASMNLPAGADLMPRLKAAYDWASANIKNKSRLTAEEREAETEDENATLTRTAENVLSERQGTSRELDFLFYGIARALGAEASVVLTTDRQEHYFNPNLLSLRQFDWTLVAVKTPGLADSATVFVDLGSGLPFGQIPWWTSGALGFQAKPDGYQVIPLYPSEAKQNLSETKARIEFNLEEQTAPFTWTRSGSGQQGFSERWSWRGLDPLERQKQLDEYCGAHGDFEVSKASSPKLDDLNAPFQVECEGTLMNTGLRDGLGTYSFYFEGPWVPYFPQFTEAERKQPVIFPFPRLDTVTVDVKSPPGFVPAGAMPVPPVESPFGRYALFVTVTPEGYHVERLYALAALVVPPKDYPALKKFLADVRRADESPLVFKRQGAP